TPASPLPDIGLAVVIRDGDRIRPRGAPAPLASAFRSRRTSDAREPTRSDAIAPVVIARDAPRSVAGGNASPGCMDAATHRERKVTQSLSAAPRRNSRSGFRTPSEAAISGPIGEFRAGQPLRPAQVLSVTPARAFAVRASTNRRSASRFNQRT